MSRVSLNKSQYSQYGSRRVRKISTVRFENSSLFGNMRAFKRFLSSFLGDLIRFEFQGTIVSLFFIVSSYVFGNNTWLSLDKCNLHFCSSFWQTRNTIHAFVYIVSTAVYHCVLVCTICTRCKCDTTVTKTRSKTILLSSFLCLDVRWRTLYQF